MLIDSHCHLDRCAREGTLPAVLARARAAGVEQVVTIGTHPGDWTLYRELAATHRGTIHWTAGLHPTSVGEDWEDQLGDLETLLRNPAKDAPAPVALGEIGLDRYHLPKEPAAAEADLARQRRAFAAQLALAKELGLPVVVHSREAFAECVEMVDASGADWGRVVFHCFSGPPAEWAELRRRGGRASFTGIITYPRNTELRATVAVHGLEGLLLETDAPYLAPAPHRGKANEPAFLRHTAEAAAAALGVSPAAVEKASAAATRAFFRLPTP